MDANELARKMLEWQEVQAKADLLKMDIEAAVLELGKTQTVGNIRASYSAGRKIYYYEEAWRANGYGTGVDIETFAKVTYDYKGACAEARIEDIPFTQSAPSVSLKIIA
jgi:hypothetical protein